MNPDNENIENTAPYAWAENPSKLQRAKTEVEAQGKKFTDDNKKEEAVKVVYKRLLGRIVGESARGASDKTAPDLDVLLEEAREEGRQEGVSEEALAKIRSDAKEEGKKEAEDEIDVEKIKEEAKEEGREEIRKEWEADVKEKAAANK
jgi:hypothetical protein